MKYIINYRRPCAIAVMLILLYILPAIAQSEGSTRIDSLESLLIKANEDTNKIILLNSLSYAYYNISPEEGAGYATEGLALARKLKWKAGEAMSCNNLGINYKAKADYPQALRYYLDALAINEQLNNKKSIAGNLANISNVYQNQGDYPKAKENLLKALKINQEIGNKKGIANNLENLSNLFDREDDFAKALAYSQKALDINKELGNKNDIATTLGNIGTIYSSMNDFGQSLAYSFMALRQFTESGNKNGRAFCLGNIGEVYYAIARRPDGVVKPDSLISKNRRVDLQQAVLYLTRAIEASRETGFLKGVMKFSKTLSKAYSLSGEDKKALVAFQQYVDIHDSIFSADNNKQMKLLENRHDKELKDRELLNSKLDAERKQKNMYIFMGGMAVLLVVLAFLWKERKKSESLLLNILPAKIAGRLKMKEHPIADHFKNVSIMFIDMAGFTEFAEARPPKETVGVLNDIFTHFDALAEKHGLEKIKTIGDCYMAVSGVPEPTANHAVAATAMAVEIKETMKDYVTKDGTALHFRIGLDCGPVVAGVIGKKKFIYDLWGDAVNTASRMEMTGIAGEIHCTDNFKIELENTTSREKLAITFVNRGMVEVKSKGQMQTWLIS
jgi:class 3 adenylate cyclase/tetratricopeptide (TPR) repeat protein